MTRFELRTQKLLLIGTFLILHAICRQRVKKTSLIEVAGKPIDVNANQIEATGDEIAWFNEWQQHIQLIIQAEVAMNMSGEENVTVKDAVASAANANAANAPPEGPNVLHQESPLK